MGEPWETIVRWAIIIGLAVFLWSVAASLEQIAQVLTRLADAEDGRRGTCPSPPGESTGVPERRVSGAAGSTEGAGVRCSRCGGRVRFLAAGIGHSDPPGCSFFPGLAFALAAAARVAAGVLRSWWWLPWAGLSAAAAALLVWWSWVATDEGYGNRCEACGQDHPVRPWSL